MHMPILQDVLKVFNDQCEYTNRIFGVILVLGAYVRLNFCSVCCYLVVYCR